MKQILNKLALFTRQIAFRATKPGAEGRKAYTIIFLVYFLPPIILIGANLIVTNHFLSKLALEQYKIRAHSLSEVVHYHIHRVMDFGENISTNSLFRQLTEQGDWNQAIESVQIFQLANTDLPVNRIFLTDKDGIQTAAYPELTGAVGVNFSWREWYEPVASTKESYVTSFYKRSAVPQINVLTVAVPIIGNQGMAGILAIQLDSMEYLRHLREQVRGARVNKVYLFDKDGNILDENERGIILTQMSGSLLNEVKSVEVLTVEDHEYVYAYSYLPSIGLGMILAETKSDLFVLRRMVGATSGIIFAIIILFYLSLVKPIVKAITDPEYFSKK